MLKLDAHAVRYSIRGFMPWWLTFVSAVFVLYLIVDPSLLAAASLGAYATATMTAFAWRYREHLADRDLRARQEADRNLIATIRATRAAVAGATHTAATS